MRETELIDSDTIRKTINYKELINTIEEAFLAYKKGNAKMPPKSYVDIDEVNGDFRSMPAYIRSKNINGAGVKWVNVHPNNTDLPTVMAVVIYNDPSTGFPLAILDGTEVTGLRTGAVAAVATDHLAHNNISTLGIVGAGAQAYEQVNSIQAIRDFDKIIVSDIDDKKVQIFRETYQNRYDIVRESPEYVAKNSDVISTLTPVEEPIIDSIKDGIHVNAMGADAKNKQEFNPAILKQKGTNIFVDDFEQAIHSGEVSKPYQNGNLDRSSIEGTLGEVIQNKNNMDQKTTIFDSTGLAIQDIATANLVYRNLEKEDNDKFNFV